MLWRSPSPARHPAGFVEPCLPTLGQAVPSGPQSLHEIKHDGYRFICRVEGNRIRVFSRRGNDYTDRVPRIVDTLARLPASSVTLDAEGVACDPGGVTNFELLRAALGRPAKREVFLYAFDLLELDGRDMRREPWSDRRWKLARLLRGAGSRRPVIRSHGRKRRRGSIPPRLRNGARRHRRQASRPDGL
jgi:bifunctional non-homologous end joining protein LigD